MKKYLVFILSLMAFCLVIAGSSLALDPQAIKPVAATAQPTIVKFTPTMSEQSLCLLCIVLLEILKTVIQSNTIFVKYALI